MNMGTYNSTQGAFFPFYFLTLNIMASENSKTIAGEPISVISAHKNNTTCNAQGGKKTQWEVIRVFNQRSKHIQRRKTSDGSGKS